MGALGLALTGLVWRAMERKPAEDGLSAKEARTNRINSNISFEEIKPALLYGGATILFGGTLFFLSPSGLSAWLSSLPIYLRGWMVPSGMSTGRLLWALVAYQPLALLLGVAGLVRGWYMRNPLRMQLSLWVLMALLLGILYPARQMGDLAWVSNSALGVGCAGTRSTYKH